MGWDYYVLGMLENSKDGTSLSILGPTTSLDRRTTSHRHTPLRDSGVRNSLHQNNKLFYLLRLNYDLNESENTNSLM